jgi:hypothetical protein
MTQSSYEFCKTFVKGADTQTIIVLLRELLGGEVSWDSLVLPGFIVDVLPNPDVTFASDDGSDDSDDFVLWPVLVEVGPADPDDERAIVAMMQRILPALWDAGYPAVAACDFEDELPWDGGIRRLRP